MIFDYEKYKRVIIKLCIRTIYNNRNEICKKHFDISNTTSKTRVFGLPLELDYIIHEHLKSKFLQDKYDSVTLFINKNDSLAAYYDLNYYNYKTLLFINENSRNCEVIHRQGKFFLTLNLNNSYLLDGRSNGTCLTITLYDSVADAKKDL